MSRKQQGRTSGQWGFSLNEAARIQSALAGHQAPKCPRCENRLWVTTGTDGHDELDLVTCNRCEATVMVRLSGDAPGGLALRR